MVWCFDHKPYLRSRDFKLYKQRSRKVTDEEERSEDELRMHIDKLRTTYLPLLGFSNLFSKLGYEADDVMAAVFLPESERMVLVTEDRDVYQLLNSRRAVYHPVSRQFVTANSFREKYGIEPRLWTEVKAVAGCITDNITGMEGVGETGALQYFTGRLGGTKKAEKILQYNRTPAYVLNRKLVALPYPGLDPFIPTPDQLVPDGIRKLCEALDIPEIETNHTRRRVGV
jgi:5'-3' exonuclease